MFRIILYVFIMTFPTFVSPIIRPTFSTEVSEICAGFGFNWAAEIRCLREFASSCVKKENSDKSRGLRSLPGIQPEFVNTKVSRQYNGYPNRRIDSFDHNKATYSTHRQLYRSHETSAEPVKPCGCDLSEISRNVSSQFEKRLYEVKMSSEYECGEKLEKLREKLETDLSEYQRMIDGDLREIKRKLLWMESSKIRKNGYEYAYLEKFESWYTAEEHCIGWGGHLASIADFEENRLISDLIPREQNAWIGLNDVQKENIFVNTDRTKSKFRNWKKGQPDNGQHNENCVLIDSTGEWNDLLCLVTRPFLCKRKY